MNLGAMCCTVALSMLWSPPGEPKARCMVKLLGLAARDAKCSEMPNASLDGGRTQEVSCLQGLELRAHHLPPQQT